ncbi:MAG TPA: Lin1244/Lin1753 domain-containing protein [Candidatus Nitrosocosmicus sp.]|nr:Lin1244/Lin1753 domain-containing protein [Candidatus Nitrosocosmicus sp.]
MLYFKHQSDMRHDPMVRRIIRRFGMDGYGLYCLILETITEDLSTEKPLPNLRETAQDIAETFNMQLNRVEEIITFMAQNDLIEIVNNVVTCNKIYKYLEQSQTRSAAIRSMIGSYKAMLVSDTPCASVTNMKEPEPEPEPEPDKNIFDIESIPHRLANLLRKSHLVIDQNYMPDNDRKTRNTLQQWAKHIDLMIRIDKRLPNEIANVIAWCKKDEFWSSNIMSAKKLREKYDQLYAKMKSSSNLKPKKDENPNLQPGTSAFELLEKASKISRFKNG